MLSIHLTSAVQAEIWEKAAPLAIIIQILTTRRGRYIENKSIFQRTIRKLITTHAGLVHAICHPLSVLSTKMRQSEAFCININFIAYTQRCSAGISTDSAQTDGRKYVGAQTIFIFIILAGNDFVRWWWTLFGPLVVGGAGGGGPVGGYFPGSCQESLSVCHSRLLAEWQITGGKLSELWRGSVQCDLLIVLFEK